MVINHAGNLKKDYFVSYIRLIMNAHQCNVENAKDYVFQSCEFWFYFSLILIVIFH